MIVICEILKSLCKDSDYSGNNKSHQRKCENLYTPIQETNASTTGGHKFVFGDYTKKGTVPRIKEALDGLGD